MDGLIDEHDRGVFVGRLSFMCGGGGARLIGRMTEGEIVRTRKNSYHRPSYYIMTTSCDTVMCILAEQHYSNLIHMSHWIGLLHKPPHTQSRQHLIY